MSATRKSPSKLKIAAVVESPLGPREYLRETVDRYHAARERVGDHPPQQLNWLVSVLQRDPQDLRTALESVDSDFRLELAWFGHASAPWSTGPAEEILEALAQLRVTLSNFRQTGRHGSPSQQKDKSLGTSTSFLKRGESDGRDDRIVLLV